LVETPKGTATNCLIKLLANLPNKNAANFLYNEIAKLRGGNKTVFYSILHNLASSITWKYNL